MSLKVLGGGVNSSLVTLKNGEVLVIDTGANAEEGREVYVQAAELGRVVYVINTHEHADHLGGNKYFSCPIISSVPARELIARFKQEHYPLPTITFSEQMTLFLGEPVEISLMGGHSPGASVIYFPERKLLFTGDMVFNGRMPYMGVANFPEWLENLRTLESWNPEVVVPGHGPVGGVEVLSKQREWLEGFIGDINEWARQGLGREEMFKHVLTRHSPPERWYSMIRHAIEFALVMDAPD